MCWSKTIPNEPGHYWARKLEEETIVRVEWSNGGHPHVVMLGRHYSDFVPELEFYSVKIVGGTMAVDVLDERKKQDEKWGVQNHGPLKWLAVLGEEFGEVAKEILAEDGAGYRAEMISVAAVECYDREHK